MIPSMDLSRSVNQRRGRTPLVVQCYGRLEAYYNELLTAPPIYIEVTPFCLEEEWLASSWYPALEVLLMQIDEDIPVQRISNWGRFVEVDMYRSLRRSTRATPQATTSSEEMDSSEMRCSLRIRKTYLPCE
jgi:hypothetical protein